MYAPNLPKNRKVNDMIQRNSLGMVIVKGDMKDTVSYIDSKKT